MTQAACTIIAKNYVAQARVLARSYLQHHPDHRMFVLFVDEFDHEIDPADEPFEVVRLADLAIPDVRSLLFKYTVLELSTAVKPYLLEHLMEVRGVDRLLYLDPDIMVFDSLEPLFDHLADHPIVLTPHITEPIDDGGLPNERTFLKVGTYNLGFIGLAASPVAARMLRWWQDRLHDGATHSAEDGLFVDQKWMDLAPGLFPPVKVDTDPGYNVAYWNLHGRKVTSGSKPTVNGRPLRFFHYSGYSPTAPMVVSKHQTRFSMIDVGDARDLFQLYRQRLLDEGYRRATRWAYTHDHFDNGRRIAPVMRDLYRSLNDDALRFGDPFVTGGHGSFLDWAVSPVDPALPQLTHLARHVPAFRDDIARAYPDASGADRDAFLKWYLSHGWRELQLERSFIGPRARQSATRPARARPRSAGCPTCRTIAILQRLGMHWVARRLVIDTLRTGRGGGGGGLRQRLAAVITRTLKPCDRHLGLGNLLVDPRTDANGRTRDPIEGVNLAGYLTTSSGVGEAARLMARALDTTGLPHALINFEQSHGLRRTDTSIRRFAHDNPHRVNLVHVNADQVPVFLDRFGRSFLENRRNIGYWMWELSEFPEEWHDRFGDFDEIWAPSRFTAEAIGRASPVPTRCVPLPVTAEPDDGRKGRDYFDIPSDRTAFGFLFDYRSVFARKNPLAVVEAFQRAFDDTDRAVLVLKCSNADGDPVQHRRLLEAIRHPGVRVISGTLESDEVRALIRCCDAYVSLHRSEGYGLTLAEAMVEGKPVIATDYSGNRDFMTEQNSYPVPYELVELQADEGPYRRGNHWADPDIERAAALMRRVHEDPDEAARRGLRARQDMMDRFSPQAVGRLLLSHLEGVEDVSPSSTPRTRRRPARRAAPSA